MPIYYAIIETPNASGRLANLTQALATMEAYSVNATARTKTELAGTVYWTNLFTGCYMVSVSDDTDGLSVVFRLLVHADDQTEFADVAALHMRSIEAEVASIATWTAANVSSGMTSGTITQVRGNTWSFDIEDLTLDSNKQQFFIKSSYNDADSAAILAIDSDTGLLYVNGAAAADASKASLSYTGTTLTVTVDPSITALLPRSASLIYGIQSVTAAGVVTEAYGGTFIITADTVRAVE